MSDYNPSVVAKLIFAFACAPVVWFVYGGLERKGFQAAGVVCSSLICSTAFLIFIYLNYMGKGWFRVAVLLLAALGAGFTVLAMRLDTKLSSAWMIPIALGHAILFGALIEHFGARFEGHAL